MFGKDKQLLRASQMNFFIQNTVTLTSLTSRSDRLLGFGVFLFGLFQKARFFYLRGLNNDDENSGSILFDTQNGLLFKGPLMAPPHISHANHELMRLAAPLLSVRKLSAT